ncbi:MAG: hypothetical protein COA47_06050 [Robiginitomaculum sp.]|nr:MAG: hypothetical protein COA47_06050 [Robiginitomaculum sp.]
MQLAPDFAHVMSALTIWLTDQPNLNWDVINLGHAPHKLFSPLTELAGHRLTRAHYFPLTTTALLWSRPGAQRFVQTSGQIFAPVDHFFRKWCATHNGGLDLSPAIVSPSGAPSDIDDTTQTRQNTGYFWREFKRQSTTYAYAGYHNIRFKPFGPQA